MNDKELMLKKCLPRSSFILDHNLVQQLQVSVRTRNCLGQYVKSELEEIRLSEITFGDLTRIPNMGSKSIIEFLAYMEDFQGPVGGSDQTSEIKELQTTLDHLVLELRRQPWTREIISGDARFPQIMRPIGDVHLQVGDSFEILLEGLTDFSRSYPPPQIQGAIDLLKSVKHKVDELQQMPLDDVLKDFISSHFKRAQQHNLAAIHTRFGLIREGTLTLEEAGHIAGVTRERIRQIEKKIIDRIVRGDNPTFMPGLSSAISLLNSNIGVNVLDYSDQLQSRRITSSNISADSIILFAKLCNYSGVDVEIKRISDGSRIITREDFNVNRITTVCGRLFSRNGIADIRIVARHFDIREEEFIPMAQTFLANTRNWKALDKEKRWWIHSGDSKYTRNRLINIARKVLCVSNPISVDDLREGYLKTARLRNSSSEAYSGDWAITVPSRAAMLAFFSRIDGYSVNDDLISTEEFLDYRQELGDVERTIIEVFLTSPTGVLRRNDILRECVKRGINENSLIVYTTYSPVIQHIAQETFKLIGKFVPAEALSAHQAALSQKIRTKRILVADWKNGRIRLCVRCPEQVASMVIGALLPSRRFLSPRNLKHMI